MKFEPMVDVVPAAKKGVAVVDHFEVSKQESYFTSLRAAFGRRQEYVEPGRYARLTVDGTLMMTDTKMEKDTNRGVIYNAKGRVLIAGLGLGCILVPILRKAEVKSVTVVEKYQDVVDLIEPAIRAKVPEARKLQVVTADIFTWKPEPGEKWDTIYFDIWPETTQENLPEMAKLHQRFAKRKASCTAWMESWQRGYLKMLRNDDRRRYGSY